MKSQNKSARVGLLDEIRGFAILCMVVYHAMYTLKYVFEIDVPIFFEDWFDIIRDIFAGAFIFIAGAACRFSSNNLKRGVKCFFLGMLITFVLALFPDAGGTIYFGILHFMGIAMMVYALSEKALDFLPALVGIIVCVLLFVLTINVRREYYYQNGVVMYNGGFFGIKGLFEWSFPDEIYKAGALFPLGFAAPSLGSLDYFPILPWLFLFLAGSYFGIWAKAGSLPKFFYPVHIKWLSVVGKYTIWIYILHQPIIYLVFWLIFRGH